MGTTQGQRDRADVRQGATYLEDENTIAVRGLSEAEVRPRARGLSQIGKKIACSRVHSTGAAPLRWIHDTWQREKSSVCGTGSSSARISAARVRSDARLG